jgi:hypothetical protein
MSEAEVLKLTIAQLKDKLKKRSIQFSNQLKKEKLRECLRYALSAKLPVVVCICSKDDKEKSKKKQLKEKADNLVEFAPGSYWMSLAAETFEVPEPVLHGHPPSRKNMLLTFQRNTTLARNLTNMSFLGLQM